MAKITTPISTNQMTRFIQHTKERYIIKYILTYFTLKHDVVGLSLFIDPGFVHG